MSNRVPRFVRENIERLRDECREKNLSLIGLSRLTGVAIKAISQYANGKAIPRAENYNKLAEFFEWRFWSNAFEDVLTLNPCPFCNDEAGILRTFPSMGKPEFVVQCWGCNTRTNYFSSPDEAADAWNRRA